MAGGCKPFAFVVLAAMGKSRGLSEAILLFYSLHNRGGGERRGRT